jgi:hypothetical protein
MTGEPGAYRGLAPSRQKLECKQLAWCVARNRIKDGFDYSRRFVRVPKREHYLAWRETKLIPHMRELTAAGEQAYSGCTVRIPPPAFTATSRISSA